MKHNCYYDHIQLLCPKDFNFQPVAIGVRLWNISLTN